MISYLNAKKRALKRKPVREAYDALEPEFALAKMLIEQRLLKGLTQAALARRVGTKQSAIARLESGNCNPTLGLLQKVVKALGAHIVVSIRRST